jgi:hypothetical protein
MTDMNYLKNAKIEYYKHSEYQKTKYYNMLDKTHLRSDVDKINTPDMIGSTLEGESIIAVIQGDLIVDTHLMVDNLFDHITQEYSTEKPISIPLIIFTGDVIVERAIVVKETEYLSEGVVFTGSVICQDLFAAGISMVFLNELEVKRLYMFRSQGEGECVTKKNIISPIVMEYDSCIVRDSEGTELFGFPDPSEIPEIAVDTIFKNISNYFVRSSDSNIYYFNEEMADNTLEDFLMEYAINNPSDFS